MSGSPGDFRKGVANQWLKPCESEYHLLELAIRDGHTDLPPVIDPLVQAGHIPFFAAQVEADIVLKGLDWQALTIEKNLHKTSFMSITFSMVVDSYFVFAA